MPKKPKREWRLYHYDARAGDRGHAPMRRFAEHREALEAAIEILAQHRAPWPQSTVRIEEHEPRSGWTWQRERWIVAGGAWTRAT